MKTLKRLSTNLLIALFALVIFAPTSAQASHSWGGYHWARTSNPLTLKLGDNLTSNWDPFLATTSTDWSASSIIDTSIVAGNSNPRRCQPTSGRVEVCNSKYGSNGWLGIAQIWLSGNHITQGVTKLNDTYFSKPSYNTPAWKNLVMCQEVGHVFGLDHQDETFNNTNMGTCMDYTDDPSGLIKAQLNNEHPDAHDYAELESIYAHLDAFTSIQSSTAKLPLGQLISEGISDMNFESRKDWGEEMSNNGKVARYERNLGSHRLVTFVIWAQE